MDRAVAWLDAHPTLVRFYVPFVVTVILLVQIVQSLGGCPCR